MIADIWYYTTIILGTVSILMLSIFITLLGYNKKFWELIADIEYSIDNYKLTEEENYNIGISIMRLEAYAFSSHHIKRLEILKQKLKNYNEKNTNAK